MLINQVGENGLAWITAFSEHSCLGLDCASQHTADILVSLSPMFCDHLSGCTSAVLYLHGPWRKVVPVKCSVSIFPTQITRLENPDEFVHSRYFK